MASDKFYITTTLPYVNAPPHIGFALEIVQADAIARRAKLSGKEVVFNTGTDEHGLKIYRKALEAGKNPRAYVDEYAAKFDRLKEALNLSYTNFIRTTETHHVSAAQEFWRLCSQNGDIYKAAYKIKYCVGCELEKTDSELKDGRCPIHPNLELEVMEEENYFFRFSKYQEKLLNLYAEYPDFVLPAHRLTEIKNFVSAGLQDFSISRLKSKMPWGVPVPGDEDHVMYVWFDALINYVSTLGWPENESNFRDFWGGKDAPRAVQVAGKDNLRQQSAMWQAMLLSAGLPPSRQILIHGFITSGGDKMSKSLGNVVDPFEIVKKCGTDALRFWFLKDIPTFEDADFVWDKFKESYNAHLANGLGNFAARTLTLAETAGDLKLAEMKLDEEVENAISDTRGKLEEAMAGYKLNDSMDAIWKLISFGDGYINRTQPWKTGDKNVVYSALVILDNLAAMLQPFLPGTAEKITSAIRHADGIMQAMKTDTLFPRLDS